MAYIRQLIDYIIREMIQDNVTVVPQKTYFRELFVSFINLFNLVFNEKRLALKRQGKRRD